MKFSITALVLGITCVLAAPARADKIVASAPVKAYKGPEGQIVVMVEVNDGKEMMVHFRNLDKELDGKTLRYLLEVDRHGDKVVYVNKKRGSKTYRSTMLTSRDNSWEFFHPSDFKVHFGISYSEETTAKFKAEDVISAYKP